MWFYRGNFNSIESERFYSIYDIHSHQDSRNGFNIGAAKSRRSKHIPPAMLPDVGFIEPSRKTVLTTSGAIPAKPSMSISTPSTSTGTKTTGTTEKTIGTMLLMGQGTGTEEVGQLPIISTVYSMSTVGGTQDPEEAENAELACVSTIRPDLTVYDQKEQLTSSD